MERARASQGAGNFSRFAAKNSNIEKKPVRGEKVKNAGTEKNAGHFRAMPRSRDTSQKRPAQIQKLILMHMTNPRVKSKSNSEKNRHAFTTPANTRQTRSGGGYSPEFAPLCRRICSENEYAKKSGYANPIEYASKQAPLRVCRVFD